MYLSVTYRKVEVQTVISAVVAGVAVTRISHICTALSTQSAFTDSTAGLVTPVCENRSCFHTYNFPRQLRRLRNSTPGIKDKTISPFRMGTQHPLPLNLQHPVQHPPPAPAPQTWKEGRMLLGSLLYSKEVGHKLWQGSISFDR